MKAKSTRIIAFLLSCILAISLSACKTGKGTKDIKPETTEAPDPSIAIIESYNDAAKVLNAETMLLQKITIDTLRSVGTDEYSESIERTADFMNLKSEDMVAVISEKKVLDSTVINNTQTFRSGKIYSEYESDNGLIYAADMTQESFMARCVPSVIIDAALYESVSYADGDESTILFKDATALESWVAPEYATLISAEGAVKLSAEGTIEEMTYTVQYRQGPANISSEYTVVPSVSTSVAEEQAIPAEADCKAIDNIDIPMYLLYFTNSIDNSSSFISRISRDIMISSSEGVMITSSSSESFDLYKDANTFAARSDGSMSISDYTGTDSYTWTNVFEDGKALFTENDGTPTETDATPTDFTNATKKALKNYLPDVAEFSEVTTTDTGEFVLFEYKYANDTYLGTYFEDYVSDTIYGDSSFLDSVSNGYSTAGLGGYIAVDKDTLLPTSVNLTYAGQHIIDGDTVSLILTANQSIDIANDEAYKNVTDKYLAEEEPEDENKATPLLYEVTSPEGAKMYLFGTIHLGDERTAYLPDEIYTAFDESDALAVEVNVDTFEDRVLADTALLTLLQESYYYTDGTTVKDHIPEELYGTAVAAMKITGDYSGYWEISRPSLWSSSLDYFILDSSKLLYSYKGVDNRLISLANETKKEIRDVEDLKDRLNMELEYPEKAHEMLLEASVSTARYETIEGTLELYELWCEGDEEKLIEYIREEEDIPEDATEEEIAAAAEYDRIMVTDRDAKMIEKAKEYLSSTEETVFFAVGLAHLLGETGLVDALREAGYTVKLVEYK